MRIKQWMLPVGVLAAGILVAGCADENNAGSTTPSHVHTTATVVLSQSSLTLKTGEHVALTASPTCIDGVVLSSPVTWTSSNPSIVTVSSTGDVLGVGFGTATISASADGKTGEATVVVQPLGTVIGAAGGAVASSDNAVILTIPAGALDTTADIVIVPLSDATFGNDGSFVPGTGYEIRPIGLALKTQARLQLRFNPANLPAGVVAEQLRIRERDRTQNQWRDCDHLGVQGQQVMAQIQNFGAFGIVVQPLTGKYVGPQGGQVLSADGNVILDIQAGALDAATEIVVTKVTPTLASRALRGLQALRNTVGGGNDPVMIPGTEYQIEPAGLQFKIPARLEIMYEAGNLPSGMTPERLRIQRRDQVQNRWQDCVYAGQQPRVVGAVVQTLGNYAIFGMNNLEPAPVAAVRVSSGGTLAVEEGDVIQLSAEVLDADGNVVDVPVTWTVSDPTIATVDADGTLTALATGSTTVTASAGGKKGSADVAVNKKVKIGTVIVSPLATSVSVGGTVSLTAEVKDSAGNVLPSQKVTWTSSATAVATVSPSGVVTGVSAGTTIITARSGDEAGTATVTVSAASSTTTTITITGLSESLKVGATVQLTATAYESGTPVSATFSWTSANPAIATVSSTGLVTGVAAGSATITATAKGASASVTVRVVGSGSGGRGGGGGGGETETLGNNMSWPVVFAEGTGVTGLAVATDPGVRPTTTEAITVDTLPFWYSGNVANYENYYTQQSTNTWRAQLIDGTGQAKYDAEAYWGDNITSREWPATTPIRIEVALSATAVGTLKGFNMYLLYGSGQTEMQGTDGTTADFIPLLYTVGPTFTVERLSGPGGSVIATLPTDAIKAEVSVSGRVVYGAQLRIDDWTPPAGVTLDGYYRLRFILAGTSNAAIKTVGNAAGMFLPVVVSPTETAIEIHITP